MFNLCIQPFLRDDGDIWSKWEMTEFNVGKLLLFESLFFSQMMEQEAGL